MSTLKRLLVALATVLSLVSCSGDSSPDAAPSSPSTMGSTSEPPASGQPSGARELTIKNFAFEPSNVTIPAGTAVKVTNEDGAVHTWTSDGNWDSGDLEKGDSFTFVFEKKGTFSYDCTPHSNMTGTITVT